MLRRELASRDKSSRFDLIESGWIEAAFRRSHLKFKTVLFGGLLRSLFKFLPPERRPRESRSCENDSRRQVYVTSFRCRKTSVSEPSP